MSLHEERKNAVDRYKQAVEESRRHETAKWETDTAYYRDGNRSEEQRRDMKRMEERSVELYERETAAKAEYDRWRCEEMTGQISDGYRDKVRTDMDRSKNAKKEQEKEKEEEQEMSY